MNAKDSGDAFGSLIYKTDHRPWQLPSGPWVIRQTWEDLCFLHFEVDVQELRALVPTAFNLDTYEGKAWIGIVPFRMEDVMVKRFPKLPYFSSFNECNVRTYVSYQGKPGVYFFSLDCTNRIAIWIGKRQFNMPYLKATILRKRLGEKTYYFCKRRHSDKIFEAVYQPVAECETYPKESFEIWSTERYCLYTHDKRDNYYRCEVQHLSWPLQKAEINIMQNNLLSDFSFSRQHPSVLYSKRIQVITWPLERLTGAGLG